MTAVPRPPRRERSPRAIRMDFDEAARIARHARAGRLEIDDAEVAHVVDEANRRVTRGLLWGATREQQRRTVAVTLGAAAAVLVAIAALLAPLLLVSATG